MEESAEIGLNAKGIEVIAADRVRPDDSGISVASVESDSAVYIVDNERIETAVLVAQITVVGIGMRWGRFRAVVALHHIQIAGIGHIERTQQQRIQHAEDNGIGADCQRKG